MSNQTNNLRNELREQALQLLGSLARHAVNDLNLEDWQRGNDDHLAALVGEVLELASETLRRHGVDGTLEWRNRSLGSGQSDGRWGSWDENANNLSVEREARVDWWSLSNHGADRSFNHLRHLRVGDSLDNR
jgi:hypothetical protein